MKHSKLLVGLTVALTATLVLTGCGSKSASSSSSSSSAPAKQSKILAVGSTALQPLLEQAAKQYQTDNPKAEITVQGGGSGAGLSQVAAGSVTIGNSDIFAQEKKDLKADDLVDHQVAVVAIAPVVNKDAGVKNISTQQLIDIFQGKITNWKEVQVPGQPSNSSGSRPIKSRPVRNRILAVPFIRWSPQLPVLLAI